MRRSRHEALAGIARGPAKTIFAAVRSAFHIPGHTPPSFGSDSVRPSAHRDQQSISLLGRRTARCNRRQSRYHARADTARFRSGDCRRRGLCRQGRKRSLGRRACRRSRDHGSAGVRQVCRLAAESAAADRIVAFGVRPTRPATEYGYIRAGAPIGPDIFAIEKFVEKPDAKAAERYVTDGYLWNSGNFMFRAGLLLDEYRRFEPDSLPMIVESVERAGGDLDFVVLEPQSFARATAKSIDYAVMERTKSAAVMPVSYGWSDVGSWQAVWELSGRDTFSNSAHGPVVFVDSRSSYVMSDKQLVALFGVENLVVVTTDDAVLVAKRDDGDGLRRLVQKLKDVAPTVTEEHLKVHRPWGSYHAIDRGERFQVKRIVVKQGGRLSLQLHHHRAEHWIVVRGTARVTIGDETKTLHENESIYIPIGTKHRLENPGKIDLELIEVQTGSYLGEDDIIRIEDDYRRS